MSPTTTATHPTPTDEERTAARILEVFGPRCLDALDDAIAGWDAEMASAPWGEPGDTPGGLPAWVRDRAEDRRTRHTMALRQARIEAARDGGPEPDADGVEEAVAREVIGLYFAAMGIDDPLGAMVAAAARSISRVSAALDRLQDRITDAAISAMRDQVFLQDAAWGALRDGLALRETMAATLDRLRGAVDALPAALARHVAAALDDAGGDRAVATAMAAASANVVCPRLDQDPTLAELGTKLAQGKAQADALTALAVKAGAKPTERLDALRDKLIAPVEAEIADRREWLEEQRAAIAEAAIVGFEPVVAAARGGSATAWTEIYRVVRNHAHYFADGFAAGLTDAAALATCEADAVSFLTVLSEG